MYNKVTMLGRVAQDLALKTTPSGVSVLSFSIAVSRRYGGKGEEKPTDFFNCVAWRQEAEFIARYWTKGKPILLEGEMQNRKYTDKSGIDRQVTEILVERACFCGDTSGKSTGSGNAAQPAQEKPQDYRELTAEEFVTTPTDEDYPF